MTKEELHNMQQYLQFGLNSLDKLFKHYEDLRKIGKYEGHPMEFDINQFIYKYLLVKIQEDLERIENK